MNLLDSLVAINKQLVKFFKKTLLIQIFFGLTINPLHIYYKQKIEFKKGKEEKNVRFGL